MSDLERESEDTMERLISLFREPDYESWSPSDPQPPPRPASDEPLYFQQLLDYLRERNAGHGEDEAEDAHDLMVL
jgi:hypothetical protein